MLIVVAAVAADQLIKLAVDRNIALGETKEFIPHIMSLTHIRNSGAAWSMMEGKRWFLIGVPIIVIGFAVWYLFKNRGGSKIALVSLALVIGGGIGNLIDRIRLKEVIDYLKIEFFDFPIFNLADICVVVGAVLFCLFTIIADASGKSDSKVKTSKKKDGESNGGAEN
jgi:signal peptidase II